MQKMELKFLILTFIPLFAVFGSTEADRRFGGQQWNNSNRTVFIPFKQPGTTPPPIYTANSFGASNRSNFGSVPPPRWSGPQPTPVGNNQHRYPPYNGSVGATQHYRPNENQYGNRNNGTSLYPSLAGFGNADNAYRPTTQGTTGGRPYSPYPVHDGHVNYQSGGNQYRPTAPTASNYPHSYDSGRPTYNSGGNQYRPTAQSGAGVWNGTSGSHSAQPHGNYQNAYGNEYRPAAVQGATGNGAWNGQQNFQTGHAHYNQTGGRQPVHSGY